MKLMREITRLNTNAERNPSTEKPLTTDEASSTIAALITKVNKPKVRILTGRVMISRIGLIIALISAIKTTSQSDVQKLVISTPGTIRAAKSIVKAAISHLKRIYITYFTLSNKSSLFSIFFTTT